MQISRAEHSAEYHNATQSSASQCSAIGVNQLIIDKSFRKLNVSDVFLVLKKNSKHFLMLLKFKFCYDKPCQVNLK